MCWYCECLRSLSELNEREHGTEMERIYECWDRKVLGYIAWKMRTRGIYIVVEWFRVALVGLSNRFILSYRSVPSGII